MVAGPDSQNPFAVFPPEHESIREASPQIGDRLGRFEATLQRTEGHVDAPWLLATIAYERLERVEETVRLEQRSIGDSTLPAMYVDIERQVEETRVAIRRAEAAVASQSLREIFEDIDARLARTEETLQRAERLVAAWRREFSAPRLAENSLHIVSSFNSIRLKCRIPLAAIRTSAAKVAPLMAIRASSSWIRAWLSAALISQRPVSPAEFEASTQTAPTTRLFAAITVLLIAFIGALLWTSRSTTPETAASVAPPPAREPVTAALTTNVPAPPTREEPAVVPQARLTVQPRTIVAPQPQTFVGTLSITSVPSGAMVSINGQAAGMTPLRLARQRAGSHAVQIAQDGFERWSASVRVPADQLTQVTARLRPSAQ